MRSLSRLLFLLLLPLSLHARLVETKGTGPNLLMIAGLGASGIQFEELAARLRQHFRVTLFDMKGTARSVPDMVEEIAELMRSLRIDRAIVLGHSMGGMLALSLAVHFPKRVQALILLSTPSHIDCRLHTHMVVMDFLKQARAPKDLRCDLALCTFFGAPYIERVGKMRAFSALLRGSCPPGVGKRQQEALRGLDVRPLLPKISLPTLIIAGSADSLTPLFHGQELQANLCEGELVILRGLGHNLHMEDPALVAEAVQEWFDSMSSRDLLRQPSGREHDISHRVPSAQRAPKGAGR